MTPMMEQYFQIKNQYKDYLLFYLYEKADNIAYIMAIFNGKRDYMRVMKKFL